MILPSYRYRGPFKPQKSPNQWSCVPTSFALCLGVNVNDIIKEIGHDGSNIIFPNMKEPLCRRGFHPQELFKVCYRHNYAVTQFDVEPKLINDDYNIYSINDDRGFINNLLLSNIGVLGGHFKEKMTPHCVAWDGKYIIDPNDLIYSIDNFSLTVFYLLTRYAHDTFPEEDKEPDQAKILTSNFITSTSS